MTLTDRSISPSLPTGATHQIVDCQTQETLRLVHRGGRTTSKIPDNTEFWRAVNAVAFSSRGLTRQEVYRSVAWHVALTKKRICYASVETIAEKARLGTTATRAHLRALERDGYIETEGDRSRGRATTYYRLANPTLSDSNPTLSDSNPTLNVAKEVTKEGTEEVQKQRTVGKPTETSPKVAEKGQSRLRSSPHSAQQRMVAAIAEKLNLPDLLTAAGLEEFDELENTKKQALIWRLLRAEKRHDRRVAQTRSGRLQRKYADRRTPDPPPRPDPPPMTHETRVELEANARASGFHLIGGKWMKL